MRSVGGLVHDPCTSTSTQQVRDWLRVIASNKDRNVYELRYFNIADNEAEVSCSKVFPCTHSLCRQSFAAAHRLSVHSEP